MQFRRTTHHAVFDISDDDRAILSAFCGIAFDETVIHEAVEAIATALRIEPQQMIAQQRQLLLLAQRSNAAPGQRRTEDLFVAQGITPLGSPRGGVESLDY